MRAVLDAAVQGWGIAFVLEQFAQQELESGVLQHVLTPYWGLDDAFHLYYPHREHMPGKVRAFVEFMRTSAGKNNACDV
jgi:DNA-binding transcriptional LysR family regulator